MLKKASLLVIFSLILVNYLASGSQSCEWKAPSGHVYDVGLIGDANNGKDFETPKDKNGNLYYINPCANTEACGNSYYATPVCQIDGAQTKNSCGSEYSSAIEEHDSKNGVVYSYFGGDGGRTAKVVYLCSSSATPDIDTPVENPSLEYTITMKSKLACCRGCGARGSGGLDGGWVFIIILLCGLAVYFGAGIAINKYKYHAEGTEMIPNREFWTTLPGLVKDGGAFVVNKVRGTPSYQTF